MMVPMIVKSLKLPPQKNGREQQEKTRSRFAAPQFDANNNNSSEDDLTDRLCKIEVQ